MSEKTNIKQLLDALEPFARVYLVTRDVHTNKSDEHPARDLMPGIWPTWGDLKRAGKVWQKMGGKP